MSPISFTRPVLSRAVRLATGFGLAATTTVLVVASPGAADHTHSKQTGNGGCVLLTTNGNEGDVDLPYATEQQVDTDRAHPLHLKVHLGNPGSDGSIGVLGSAGDPCADSGRYLNLKIS